MVVFLNKKLFLMPPLIVVFFLRFYGFKKNIHKMMRNGPTKKSTKIYIKKNYSANNTSIVGGTPFVKLKDGFIL